MNNVTKPLADKCGSCSHVWNVPQVEIMAQPNLCEVDYYLDDTDTFTALLPLICAISELQANNPIQIASYFTLITAGEITPNGLQDLLDGMILATKLGA